nr:immunoglobulin light chain junction region [Macaca mulatta]
CQQYDSEPWTF